MLASGKTVGLSNIVRKFLPAFVHTAWEELKYRNLWQLSCKTQFSGNKDSFDVAHRNKIQNELGL